MKKKGIALLLGAALSLSAITGCGASEGDSSSAALDDDRIFGEVSSIDGDTITIEVGTQKERDENQRGERPDKEESDGSEKPDKDEQGRGSMLELTGEEKEITVTDDTEITRQMGGGFGGKGGPKDQEASGEEDSEQKEKPEEEPSGEKPEEKTEEITLDDISEGDTIAVTLGDDGKVTAITVISGGRAMGEPSGEEPPEDKVSEEESSGV